MSDAVVARVGDVLVVDVVRLARARERAVLDGVRLDPRLVALLDAAEAAEDAVRGLVSPRKPPPVSTVDGAGFPARSSTPPEVLRCGHVARLAGCSVQAVRKAARTGRLIGARTAAGWEFRREHVETWIRRRR